MDRRADRMPIMKTPRTCLACEASKHNNFIGCQWSSRPANYLTRDSHPPSLPTPTKLRCFRACRESIGPEPGLPHRKPSTPAGGHTPCYLVTDPGGALCA